MAACGVSNMTNCATGFSGHLALGFARAQLFGDAFIGCRLTAPGLLPEALCRSL